MSNKLKQQLLVFGFLLLTAIQLVRASKFFEINKNPYQHVKILDPEGKYKLEWLVDWQGNQIFFNVTVETRGFISFGISKDELSNYPVTGIDFIMGGVDKRGKIYFGDYYSVGNEIPVVDEKQDWILHSAWESWTHTFLSFSRPFDTGDLEEDIQITDDTLYLIWGYGKHDNTANYHFSIRGSLPIYLRDPDWTPLEVQQGDFNVNYTQHFSGSDVKVWSIRRVFKLPTKKTTYWCTIHKLSLPVKHHIIGTTVNFENKTQTNLHHMLFWKCLAANPSSVFEKFVNHPGEECYSPLDQLGEIPFLTCQEFKAVYAVGGGSIFYPENMGIPIGESGQPEYFMMQAHYDNPTGRSDLQSEVQMDIYYTSKLRAHDGGIINFGHSIPGSPYILLPPGSTNHRIYGDCSPDCSSRILPAGGIKIVASMLHAHNAGRRIIMQRYRKDDEDYDIFNDGNWRFQFQPVRLLREEVTVLPGDLVRMNCYYDTTHTNRTTVGGFGTEQEMCATLAVYYNRLGSYGACWSDLISPEYTERYLAGAKNLTWDQPRLEFMATAPPFLNGMTVSEISDSKYVDWSVGQRGRLQNDQDLLPQLTVCLTFEEVQAYAASNNTKARLTLRVPIPGT